MGFDMPIYVLDDKSGFWMRTVELFWLTIMFMGWPIFDIINWLHWEIYGQGPRRKR